MSDPKAIDPAELAAVEKAVRAQVNTFTFWGQSVGAYVTDDEIKAVAIAAINASAPFHVGK